MTYRLATAHKVTDLIRDDIMWCELRRLFCLLLIEFQLSSDVSWIRGVSQLISSLTMSDALLQQK